MTSEAGAQHARGPRAVRDFADAAGRVAVRQRRAAPRAPARSLRRDDGEEAAFAGDVERVEAEQLAGRAHLAPHRDRAFVEADADVRS